MLVDWLIYGLLVFGVAKLLNATAFKLNACVWPSSLDAHHLDVYCERGSAHGAESVAVPSHFRHVGVPISPKNPLDMGGAFVFASLFFSFLNRREKKKQPPNE